MHENRGDEQARAKVVIFFSMFDAERDNHENETISVPAVLPASV